MSGLSVTEPASVHPHPTRTGSTTGRATTRGSRRGSLAGTGPEIPDTAPRKRHDCNTHQDFVH